MRGLFFVLIDDLDIHVITPNGYEIYYGATSDPTTGGFLDVDMIPGSPCSNTCEENVENIVFPQGSPSGTYRYFVRQYSVLGVGPDDWSVVVFDDAASQVVASHTGNCATNCPDVGGYNKQQSTTFEYEIF